MRGPIGSDRSLRGAEASTVRAAIDSGEALPGTRGFAGLVDGRLVRDVLGRVPLFLDEREPGAWAFDRRDLAAPTPFPPGHVGPPAGSHSAVWSLPRPDPRGPRRARTELRDRLATTLSTVETADLAVAFSGGIDSALVAAHLEAPLFVAGFPDCQDVQTARESAERLDRELRVIELDHGTLRDAIPAVVDATGRTNAMDVAIALPLWVIARRAAAAGFDRLAVGQGADELFGGYAKVAAAPTDARVEAETVRGARREVLTGLPGQLERDVLAMRAAGVEPVAPLLDDRLVRAALALPGEWLVSPRGDRKFALRVAARQWLPDRIAFREKKALQYGTLVARELDRLARQAGFKRRMDDHVRQWIESLVT